jgi:hypothetical protein
MVFILQSSNADFTDASPSRRSPVMSTFNFCRLNVDYTLNQDLH